MYKFLTLLIFFLCFIPIYSQNFGIEAGYNLSNFNGNTSSNSLSGFNVGLILDLMEKEKLFHINSGLKYSQKGVKGDSSFTNTEYKNRLAYLEMPVNFALHIYGEDSNVGLMAEVGMYVAGDLNNDFSFDYGTNFSVGVVSRMIKVSFNYQLGLYEIYSNRKNRVFSANIALLFK